VEVQDWSYAASLLRAVYYFTKAELLDVDEHEIGGFLGQLPNMMNVIRPVVRLG